MDESGISLDTSVIDTPAPTPDIDPGDAPIDTDPAEGADDAPVTDTDPEAPPTPEGEQSPFTGRAVENGKINPAAKAVLDKLKAESPALEKQIRNALIRQDVLSREFPGGVAEVKAKIQELEATVEELGGQDGIKSTKQELGFFRDLDQQFTAGDPRFIEALISAPEGQAAFLKLAPGMIDKYASMHPEGFSAFLHGKFKSEMDGDDLKFDIIRMADYIKRLPEGTDRTGIEQHWDKLAAFYNKVNAGAFKKVDAPKLAESTKPTDDGRDALKAEREALRSEQFESTWNGELKGTFGSSWATQTKGRAMDDIQVANAKELFSGILRRQIAADTEGQKNLKKFYAAGDRAGYQRMVKAMFAKEIPKALTVALDRAAPVKNGVRKLAAVSAPGTPAATTPARTAAPAAGFSPITKAPGLDAVDFNKTTSAMWGEGKAVLQNGRKVSFPR